MRASDTVELILEDVAVPEENLLGEKDGGFIDALRVLVALHEPRHERHVELGVPARGIGERKHGNVETAAGHRRPLLGCFEKRLARVDPHLDPRVLRLELAADDLEKLPANVAVGPLMRRS